jgi:hypothetical protein
LAAIIALVWGAEIIRDAFWVEKFANFTGGIFSTIISHNHKKLFLIQQLSNVTVPFFHNLQHLVFGF